MSNSNMQRNITCPRCRKNVSYEIRGGRAVLEPHNYDPVLVCSQPSIRVVLDARDVAEQRANEELLAAQIAEELGLSIPHSWRRDEDGHVEYFELWGNHGGPECTRCGEVFCQHCSSKEWGEPCEEQTQNLF